MVLTEETRHGSKVDHSFEALYELHKNWQTTWHHLRLHMLGQSQCHRRDTWVRLVMLVIRKPSLRLYKQHYFFLFDVIWVCVVYRCTKCSTGVCDLA